VEFLENPGQKSLIKCRW